MKTCTKCNQEKPLEDFIKDRRRKQGYASTCKPCDLIRNRKYRKEYPEKRRATNRTQLLKSRYNMSDEDYDTLHTSQGGVCKICSKPESSGGYLVVDHCHTTGKVRGLLCHNCNKGLGMFKDQASLLNSAINYLNE